MDTDKSAICNQESKMLVSVAVESLGCKLNQAEAASWAHHLRRAGYRLVDSREKAQVYVLNTCTLTHVADRKSRHLLRMARRRSPGALIVATGCYAERAAKEIAQIGVADLVFGNADKERLVELINRRRSSCHSEREQKLAGSQGWLSSREESGDPQGGVPLESDAGPGSVALRTRALVKIQDGCDEFCTYCIVPLVRGRQRSRPAANVLNDIEERVAEGCQEVSLTGTQIGAYGRDVASGGDLGGLVRRILAETRLPRLRLTSIHPQDLSEDLLGLWRDERLCRHLHLSLQSGSDSVLKRMGRPYTTAAYARAVERARLGIPDVAVTTDVIVGFPGESDGEFAESRAFCEGVGFARMHVFVYSARPGTPAAAMPGQIHDAVKRERSRIMLKLAEEAGHRFRRRFLGAEIDVLWEAIEEGDGPERVWSGLSGNYIRVYARSKEDLSNRLLRATPVRAYRDGLWGELAAGALQGLRTPEPQMSRLRPD